MAKTLYVDTATGNDATTYANNDAAHPWATIARAAWGSTVYASPDTSQAAAAGDTVRITAGVYWEKGNTATGGGSQYAVCLSPANSGTAGNLITFLGVGGTVDIRAFDATIRGPMIGSNGKNYIVWDSVTVNDYYCGSLPDTGPVCLGSCTGCQILRCEIIGHGVDYYWGHRFASEMGGTATSAGSNVTGTASQFLAEFIPGTSSIGLGGTLYPVTVVTDDQHLTVTGTPGVTNDPYTMSGFKNNYEGLRLGSSVGGTVKNNRIHGFYNPVLGCRSGNEGCIILYDSDSNIIEHNNCYDSGIGIFVKGIQTGTTLDDNIIRYNFVYDILTKGIQNLEGRRTLIYQNLVIRVQSYGLFAGFFSSDSARFVNNTVYNCGTLGSGYGGLVINQTTGGTSPTGPLVDVHFKNHIVSGVASYVGVSGYNTTNFAADDIKFDYNFYYNASPFAQDDASNTPVDRTFATWQGYIAAPKLYDQHGSNGTDPLFVSGTPLLPADFKLQGGSTARNFGIIVESIGGTNGNAVNCGCYITGNEEIGVESGTASVSSPRTLVAGMRPSTYIF